MAGSLHPWVAPMLRNKHTRCQPPSRVGEGLAGMAVLEGGAWGAEQHKLMHAFRVSSSVSRKDLLPFLAAAVTRPCGGAPDMLDKLTDQPAWG